jgi:hypothetical protein
MGMGVARRDSGEQGRGGRKGTQLSFMPSASSAKDQVCLSPLEKTFRPCDDASLIIPRIGMGQVEAHLCSVPPWLRSILL